MPGPASVVLVTDDAVLDVTELVEVVAPANVVVLDVGALVVVIPPLPAPTFVVVVADATVVVVLAVGPDAPALEPPLLPPHAARANAAIPVRHTCREILPQENKIDVEPNIMHSKTKDGVAVRNVERGDVTRQCVQGE